SQDLYDHYDRYFTMAARGFESGLLDLSESTNGKMQGSEKTVLELMADLGLRKVIPVGHSMGGKVAMWLALNHPDRVEKLVVVDIAPVRYQGGLKDLLDAMLALPLEKIGKRGEADAWLKAKIPDAAVRAYLLQNLVRTEGGWRWRANLKALRDGLHLISDFPEPVRKGGYPGPALFIHGSRSDYLEPKHLPRTRQLFPNLELVALDAGHWVYAEQAEEFLRVLRGFLDA
ncbi:MAG TPA: alpha/beta fold hydrolase, partial [Chromatiaceae bacterium]|nr:alpha/beta fold hydrolase [Chromatiaceae bacterium]